MVVQLVTAAAGGYFELSAPGGGSLPGCLVGFLFGLVSPVLLLALAGGGADRTRAIPEGDLFLGAHGIAFSLGVLLAVAASAGLVGSIVRYGLVAGLWCEIGAVALGWCWSYARFVARRTA